VPAGAAPVKHLSPVHELLKTTHRAPPIVTLKSVLLGENPVPVRVTTNPPASPPFVGWTLVTVKGMVKPGVPLESPNPTELT
jgi:hypothetical protein